MEGTVTGGSVYVGMLLSVVLLLRCLRSAHSVTIKSI